MAHFARIDENNVVQGVIVVSNNDTLDINGIESESEGIAFCQMLFGPDTTWKQTSYNGRIRGTYAGIGYTYRDDLDRFVEPSPFPSWSFNETTYEWQPPIPQPTDGQYVWDEEQLDWAPLEVQQ